MKTLEKLLNLLGFEYVGRFELDPLKRYRKVRKQMPWYKKYGLFSKNYFFDRAKPRNSFAAALKLLTQEIWIFTYILFFGVWLTFAGEIYDHLTVDTEIPENPYRGN